MSQTCLKYLASERGFRLLKYLAALVLIISSFCCQTSIVEKGNTIKTGALYGKIQLIALGQKIIPITAVYLEGSNSKISADSDGTFFIPNLLPGIYNLYLKTNSTYDSLKNIIFSGIDIAQDSITLLLENIDYPDKAKYKRAGIKIKIVNIHDRGEIVGKVEDKMDGTAIRGTFISIPGTSWGTVSDSLGNFRIPGIITGEYNLRINKIGYHVTRVSNLVIIADKSAIANIFLISSFIPEEPPIQKWITQYK